MQKKRNLKKESLRGNSLRAEGGNGETRALAGDHTKTRLGAIRGGEIDLPLFSLLPK